MSNQNYITEMLELKDNNVFFYENCYYKEKIKEFKKDLEKLNKKKDKEKIKEITFKIS